MHTAVSPASLTRAFQLALTVEGLRPSTIRHYVRDVERFLRHVDCSNVKELDSAAVRSSHTGDTDAW